MLKRFSKPINQTIRYSSLHRLSKRFCYNEDYDPYFFILSMYDNEPRDGLLQLSEFEHMANVFSVSDSHAQALKNEFFPNGDEALPPRVFGELWEKLFDENNDGEMQVDEFTKMMAGFDISPEDAEKKQKKFFPTGKEELSKKQLKELYKSVERVVTEPKIESKAKTNGDANRPSRRARQRCREHLI